MWVRATTDVIGRRPLPWRHLWIWATTDVIGRRPLSWRHMWIWATTDVIGRRLLPHLHIMYWGMNHHRSVPNTMTSYMGMGYFQHHRSAFAIMTSYPTNYSMGLSLWGMGSIEVLVCVRYYDVIWEWCTTDIIVRCPLPFHVVMSFYRHFF
jgi:hypothetical protein